MQTGYALLTLDLSETTSLADALARIKAFAAAHPDRPWIIGSGWNQERWGLGRFPPLPSSTVPSAIARSGSNAPTITRAGPTARRSRLRGSPPPPRRPKAARSSGLPTDARRVLVDKAQGLVDKAVPPPTPRDDDLALTTAEADLARRGVTGIADMGTSTRDWMTFRRAGDANRLYLRIMAYAAGTDTMAEIAGPGPTPWLYADRCAWAGSSCSSTARSDRAEPGSRRLMPTSPIPMACRCSAKRSSAIS
jgi:predicted amidohydrolase YtcJ